MYFQKEIETMPRSELLELQLARLRKTVEYAMNVSLYREKFAVANIKPEDIKSLDDLKRLPFTKSPISATTTLTVCSRFP